MSELESGPSRGAGDPGPEVKITDIAGDLSGDSELQTPNSKPRTPGISACIITLNEEARLARCLDSLAFADEIIVLDGGSSDATVEIAKRYTTRVYVRTFDDFVKQKTRAVRLAACDWILALDADEVVSPGLQDEIRRIAAAPDSSRKFIAYRTPRMSFYLGQWIRHCGWYPEYKIRLFLKKKTRVIGVHGGGVHEYFVPDGPVGTLKNCLEHYSYSSISDHVLRINRYSAEIARDKFRRGKKSSVLWALLKSMSKFFITYVYHRGFMDGRAGLVISVLAAYYNFLKYIKLWELHRIGGGGEEDE